ncbi:DUF2993 domain-containing protein [Kitasatospora sp. NPDC050543]|uniref:DUF2993 domain-containing protein n=1 Tax=Kitasatospora sp. NPDC050543 TaxID=3364054 RepID=UPI00379D3130
MRGWQKLTIGLVVLSGLLVGADRIAVGVAEDQAADQLVKSGKLSARPEVSIEGFPFLTQVLSMKLDDVHLSADELTVGDGRQQVALHSFKAELSGVEVSGSLDNATVSKGTGSGLITYADLGRLLPPASQFVPEAGKLIPGNTRLSLSYGGPGKIKAALGPMQVGEGTVRVKDNTVTTDGFQLTGLASMIGGATGQHIQPVGFSLGALPAGLKLADAVPQPDGLKLTFQGTGLKLVG